MAPDRLLCDMITNSVDVAIMTTYYPGWDDRKLPLWGERVIAALPEGHPLTEKHALWWATSEGRCKWSVRRYGVERRLKFKDLRYRLLCIPTRKKPA
jgi:hypothetical protein